MKGKPALRTVLVLLLLAAVAYPVSRVISHGEHLSIAGDSVMATPVNPASLSGRLCIRTAPAPLRLEVTSLGKVVFQSTEIKDLGEVTKQLSLPTGSELIVKAEWADERPHALHAEFLPEGTNTPVARDYWSGRTLEDVLSLP